MDRFGHHYLEQRASPRTMANINQAQAAEYFEHFLNATTLKNILGYHRTMCDLLQLKPNYYPLFYPKLRAALNNWKAKALWKKLDARASHKCYGKGKISEKTRVLVIGAGPCGLRTAIEAQLLGAKVVVVEKRDRLSRNNVLHLWPFVIEDLRMLGAKKFFGKFCAGAIDHISIRQIQCILFKVALLFGVEIHTEISFENLIEPNVEGKTGWRADLKPSDHPVSQYEFDVIIGADGKRNTLQGFTRKEFRGKLAIAITANFINKRTEAEARVEEISGVAFIFNQKFFKDLYHDTGIDLENIVYYKDDTHYFVMTAKKPSLIEKGAIIQDLADTERLLAQENVNREALLNYAKEAADFSTNYQMPDLEFAVNHYGQPDVAMFDFTSMYAAENASKIVERNGYQLLMILVGDSLLEPFWPTGSGCARGFLSSLDAAWSIRTWSVGKYSPLDVLAERESIYRLLAQTTPDNLNKDWKSYTLDPATRYPNLNRKVVLPHQLIGLFDTDNIKSIEKVRRLSEDAPFMPKKRRRDVLDTDLLINWVKDQVRSHDDITISDIASIFRDGKVLCAILNHYRPDLLDYTIVQNNEPAKNNQIAIDIFEKEIGIPPIMTGQEITNTEDYLSLATYLTQIYDTFRVEIPHIKHPKLPNPSIPNCNNLPPFPELPFYQSEYSPVSNSEAKYKIGKNEKSDEIIFKRETSLLCLKNPVNSDQTLNDCGNDYTLDGSKNKYPNTKYIEDIPKVCRSVISSDFEGRSYSDDMYAYFMSEKPSETSLGYKQMKPARSRVNTYNIQNSHSLCQTVDSQPKRKQKSIYTIHKETVDKVMRNVALFEERERSKMAVKLLNKKPLKTSVQIVVTETVHSNCSKSPGIDCQGDEIDDVRCQIGRKDKFLHFKIFSLCNMSGTGDKECLDTEQAYRRVSKWIKAQDFNSSETTIKNDNGPEIETNIQEGYSDITSITKCLEMQDMGNIKKLVTDKTCSIEKKEEKLSENEQNLAKKLKDLTCNNVIKTLTKFSQYSPFRSTEDKVLADRPNPFSIIVEGPESELPESKITETTFKSVKVDTLLGAAPNVSSRPTSRHKRHVDVAVSNKVSSTERKTRKRRSVDKCSASVEERQKALEEIVANRSDRQSKRKQQRKLQTEQFLKSMQMLQANAKSDHSEPFEDYSLFVYRQTAPNFEDRVKDLEKKFTYVPDYENKLPTLARGNTDEDFAARIKSIEDGWQDQQTVEKKPKDLLRAIGKIETSDWNIREIEKKINENKLGKPSSNKDKEKVPKWSKEQFVARQTKMEKQHLDRQDSSEAKYADIDKNIRHLELKLKEGTSRDLGQNKVATLTEKLGCNVPEEPKKLLQRSNSKPMIALPTQGGSEFCHFCNKRVYLMERLSAEGRFFHHGCFKCQYCSTQLRLGSYAFDREGVYGLKFYCKHHDGLQGKLQNSKVTRKPSHRQQKSPDKRQLTGVSGLDLLDRVQTPERIEFSNLSASRASSDHEESFSQMDEDEWTDRNFRASTAEIGSSDDESSCYSESDSDDGELYEEALEEPATKEGTLKWAERIEKRHSMKYSSSDSSIDFESSTDDDDTSTATEGEEEIRARELRRLEVQVAPVPHNDTGTDTEVVSGSSDSSSQIQNSATEISTDSEFAQDDPTPIVEVPAILSNDYYVTKTRGSRPRKLQVTTGFLQKPFRNKALPKKDIELKLSPLVHAAQIIRKPAPSMLTRTEGYALNRTQSTGGIATKKSLELKRKYLLDGANIAGTIQKSGSASTLDTKFKSFRSNISDCQKLLKPATEISASMQTFCNKLDQHISPVLSPEYSAKETVCEKKLPPDLTNVEVVDTIEETPTIFENVNEGRPRSPVHETSIIVPDIDWTKKNHDHSADSLSLDSSSDNLSSPNFKYANIPTVEIHEPEIIDDLPPDSLCIEVDVSISRNSDDHSVTSDPLKSISSEKKILNQPKSLPEIENDHIFSNIHNNLHQKKTKETDRSDRELSSPEGVTSIKNASGRSTPNSLAEQLTTALTETELSDWARDGVVSDDLEDDDFDLNLESEKLNTGNVKKARLSEFEDFGHVCGKFVNDQAKHIEPMTTNLDGIEFMDTGTESSSDDGIADARNGYVLFKDEDELAEDSLDPILNDILEAKNVYINQKEKITNSGYCVIAPERNNFGGEVIDLKPSDVENLRLKQNLAEHEDDSLLILDTGTTTEENTCSDSTVKNLMEIPQENNTPVIENNNLQKFRLEEKLAQLKKEHAQLKSNNKPNSEGTETSSLKENNVETNNIEFEEHCQRLQSKVDFGNAKDSIDIKKSRRKSKDLPQKPDLIQEEKEQYSPNNTLKDITLNLTPTIRTPDLIYKKEIIEKERDVNQRLVQEMVMSKMRAENKPERKRRSRIASSLKPFELTKSATTDIVSQCNLQNLEKKTELNKIYSPTKTSITPDVLLSTNNVPLQKSETVSNVVNVDNNVSKCTPLSSDNFIKRPLSVFSTFSAKDKKLNLKSSLTDLTNYGEYRLNLSGDNFRTPVAPLRAKHDEIKRTAEKLKSDARARARLLSNEDLGLSPEDKLLKLKEKAKKRLIDNENVDVQESIQSLVMNTERRNSWLYSNDTLNKKSNNSFRRSKSGDNSMNHSQPKLMTHKYSTDNLLSTYDTPNFKLVKNESMTNRTAGDFKMICHSDPNLLDIDDKKMKKKPKDKEPKKATKFTKIMDLFSKKSPKGLFSKISPKTKVMSKSCLALMDRKDFQIVTEEPIRSKSFSEISRPHRSQNHTPPPIPPLPLHYTGSSIKGTDDSSDGDPDWRREDKDSCDTLDHSGLLDVSLSNLSGRRAGRSAKRAARQSQLKRHRMAQEIQRKLEETEVKTKELEERGVMVERALRGEEVPSCSRDESDLLQEWFDLMRDRTELRRYEKGLTVRAEELELEDRHARLQQQLRERLENSEKKTVEEMGVDHSIINEMMEIVSKRDSLISVLEEDRVRYSTEDRDFEEQILAKGIQLTPIKSLDK